jgi:hypothetical protein
MKNQEKLYFVFGYKSDGKVISMSNDGFSELSLAIEFLSNIDKSWKPFVSIRLLNV